MAQFKITDALLKVERGHDGSWAQFEEQVLGRDLYKVPGNWKFVVFEPPPRRETAVVGLLLRHEGKLPTGPDLTRELLQFAATVSHQDDRQLLEEALGRGLKETKLFAVPEGYQHWERATVGWQAPSYIHHAWGLHHVAVEAYQRLTHVDDLTPGRSDALVAVAFAAFSLEAFVNELAQVAKNRAQWWPLLPSDLKRAAVPTFLRRLAAILKDAEEAHTSPRFKYALIAFLCDVEQLEKGKQLYEKLELLFSVRDEVAHLKMPRIGQEHGILDRLRKDGLCNENDPAEQTWLDQIATKALARWACNTAADVTDALGDSFANLAGVMEPWSAMGLPEQLQENYTELHRQAFVGMRLERVE